MNSIFLSIITVLLVVNIPIASGLTTKRLGFLMLFLLLWIQFFRQGDLKIDLRGKRYFLIGFTFGLVGLLGLMHSQLFTSTAKSLFFTIVVCFSFKIFLDNCPKVNIEKLALGWFFACSILALITLFQIGKVLDFQPVKLLFLRKYLIEAGVSINSHFNQVVMLIGTFLIGLYLNRSQKLRKLVLLSFSVLLVVVVILSLSRQNTLAILVTFFFVIVFALSLKQKLVLGICAVFISGLTLISTEQNSGSIQVVGFAERIEKTVVQLNSADYPRFRQFRDSFFVGVTNPFTGVGLGGYYNFAKEKGYSEHVRVPEAALNHVIAEFGLFFFILFIFLLAFLFHKLQKTKKSKLRDYQKAIFLGTLVLFLFNEMHVQSSLWILLMFYFFHSKRVLKEEEF